MAEALRGGQEQYRYRVFFPYRFDRTFKAIWWPLGVREGLDGVTVDDDTFTATFGHWRVETARANVSEGHITRDYLWWKAIGVRASFADDGLTFGTSAHGGVCVHFVEPVDKVIGFKNHSALTVTVDDLEGLAAALAS